MRLIDADVTIKTYTADLFDTLDDFERVNDIFIINSVISKTMRL